MTSVTSTPSMAHAPRRKRRHAGASEVAAAQHAQPWLALTLLVALGTALVAVPVWCWLVVLAVVVLKALAWWRRWQPGWPVVLSLALGALAGWWFAFDQHASGAAVTAFFALVLALKWLESNPEHGRRDTLLLLWSSCVLAALGAIHQQALISMALLVLHALMLATGLAALHGQPRPVRLGMRLLGLSLPLSAALFVLTPRVNGPLWDFGLALGMPIAVNAPRTQGLGSRDSLQAGQGRNAGLEDGTVLVARFDGYQPTTAEMYWRGPVFWDFDGQRWTPGPGWENRSERLAQGYRRAAGWLATFEPRGEPLRYHLRVAGHGGPWLYALEMPGSFPPESYLTHDGQVLSMTPLRSETSFQALAWRDWRMRQPALDEARRRQALSLPPGMPRLRALGDRIARQHTAPDARIEAVLALFDPAHYRFDPKADEQPGAQGYEWFLFEQRAGGPEPFAASAVLLLRAAGVPARLVTGLRGGRMMGTSGYVLVKQSHAHAWVEAWDDAHGWRRLDPLDRVRLPTSAGRRAADARAAAAPIASGAASSRDQPLQQQAQPAWWQSLDGWLLRYDADRRKVLLDGLAASGHALVLPLLAAVLAGALLPCAMWARRGWRRRSHPIDPLATAWEELGVRLRGVGLPVPAGLCPSGLAAQLRRRPEPWAAAAGALVADWLGLRYGASTRAVGDTDQTPAQLLRRVRRFQPQAFRLEQPS